MDDTTLVETRLRKELPSYDAYFSAESLRSIPPELRAFIVEHGAIALKPNTLLVGDFETVVERILGISDNDEYDIAVQAKSYDGRLPKRHLPLAALAFGDLLTVDITTSRVHLWVHDKHDEYQMRRRRSALPVAADHYEHLFQRITPDTRPVVRDPNAKSWTKPEFLEELRRKGLLVSDAKKK
jgi:hypothetical protein